MQAAGGSSGGGEENGAWEMTGSDDANDTGGWQSGEGVSMSVYARKKKAGSLSVGWTDASRPVSEFE